ncbi:lysophospholipid acyltransferase family protein [Janthinobacterium sp. 17J80-10]|uniref:lysophospholipid acyltransferase family protein n=1 Tax=Janthinobacterium sp. 17J80-10 TaxID=2497863 RepID=UPI001005735E|nr:lysophospholipid acyltransferase family protein [Janthinobacterium sp. 17J80-10]QAU32968.1 1-acyl-sn-glycerol-3-phosphate acyltransferase [Janthinobacterium sp. 17J80-10]
MLPLLRLLRRIAGWLDFIVFTALLYLLTWLPWPGRHPVARLFHAWCRAFVRALGVDLHLHQKNRKPLPQRYILIANHPSAFEDIGIPALFDVVSLAKLQVQDWFIVGRISRAAGTLYVDRDDPASRQQSIQTMADAVNAGQNIALYPEGGCKGRRLHSEFKSGAFEVSIRTGIPILPVFLHYEAQDDFEWQPPYTLPDKIRHMASAVNNRANFYVYDPMDPKDYADKYAMKAAAYEMYVRWNAQYLE